MANMRSIANSSISFGPFINVPVKMYSAVEDHKVDFHQYHECDGGTVSRIEMPTRCKACHAEVPRNTLAKGVERGDEVIIITADELASVEAQAGKDFDVSAFVFAEEISPLYYDAPYFLEPDVKRGKRAVETYTLLREVLTASQRVGVVTYCMRGRTHLAILRPADKVLVLQNIHFPNEIRDAAELSVLDKEVKVDPKELKLATQLVEMMCTEFDASQYVDEYVEKINELIDKKANGVQITVTEEAEAAEEVGDLLAALEASVKAKEASKAAHPSGRKRGNAVAPKTARKSA